MTRKQFHAKAVEGGWNLSDNYRADQLLRALGTHTLPLQMPYEVLLLDPKAWAAVGRVEGWKERVWPKEQAPDQVPYRLPGWQWSMHKMIDALAEGKTIEQYLKTL